MKNNLPLSFILDFCRDKIAGQGEDCSCYTFCDSAGLVAVFDGCGGAGAKKHDYYSGHSEAYMASRLCSGVFYDAFREYFPGDYSARKFTEEILSPRAVRQLQSFAPPEDPNNFTIRGSLIRTLPTTAAAALVQQEGKELLVSAIWAGDSRVYILDSRGLFQLTEDDTTVPDPMDNLYDDGVLRNIFCSDKDVKLHCRTVRVQAPFMVFAATDGCFGYLSTPMEFEGMLLDTLLQAESVSHWEENLTSALGGIAGDDHTMVMAGFGYKSFQDLQNTVRDRYTALYNSCLESIGQLPMDDRQSRYDLWNQYKANYLMYLEDNKT